MLKRHLDIPEQSPYKYLCGGPSVWSGYPMCSHLLKACVYDYSLTKGQGSPFSLKGYLFGGVACFLCTFKKQNIQRKKSWVQYSS